MAVSNEGPAEAGLYARKILVERVLELRRLDLIPVEEEGIHERALVPLQLVPTVPDPHKPEGERLAGEDSEQDSLFSFLDNEEAAHGQIHNGGRDVPEVGRSVEERAGLGGGETLRWLVFRHQRPQLGISPVSAPKKEHTSRGDERDPQQEVAHEETPDAVDEGGPCDDSGVPADDDREPLPESQRPVCLELHRVDGLRDSDIALDGSGQTGERGGAHTVHSRGKYHPSRCRQDRVFGLISRHIPVQLVMLLEEPQAVRYRVPEYYGASRIVGARNPDLEDAVPARAFGLIPEVAARVVLNTPDPDPQRVIRAVTGTVFDGDLAEDAVPRPGEPHHDRLCDVEGTARQDHDVRVERCDLERTPLSGCRWTGE